MWVKRCVELRAKGCQQICWSILGVALLCLWPAGGQARKNLPLPANVYKTEWSCLPPDVKPDDIVTYGINGKKNRTVADTLGKMKARCRKGRLIGSDKREIRFFHPACWGNPPVDADEQRAAEARQLAALQKKYRVVIFSCNPQTL